jgi:asparagine synthase (glutamine-hydrolysing)
LLSSFQKLFLLRKEYGSFPPFGARNFIKEKLGIARKRKLPYHFKWLNPVLEKKLNMDAVEAKLMTPPLFRKSQRHTEALDALTKPSWYSEGNLLKPDFTYPEYRDPFLDKRMMEYVFSLPSFPWAFHKHLLRKSMKNYLPDKVLKRQKDALYGLQDALVREKQSQWIYEWKPSKELERYVDLVSVQKDFADISSDYLSLFQNGRIFILEQWLKQIEKI